MKKHYRTETDCLNCGTQLEGKYCPNCGQENLQIKESFGHMMTHAISDYFHFDEQFFSTLKPLLLKPGKLTIEYMAGRRAHYLHPVKMYIFISVVFFLLYFRDSNEPIRNKPLPKTITHEKLADTVKKAIESDKNLSSVQKQKIEYQVKKLGPIKIRVGKLNTEYGNEPDNVANPNFDVRKMLSTDDTTYSEYLANQKLLPAIKRDGFLKNVWDKKIFDYHKKYGGRAREVFFEEFKHNVPKMMFILLPLFALILKLAFWKNHKFYVEHLIYSFHLHCFLFLFLAFAILLTSILPGSEVLSGWISGIGFLIICWYIYRSLKTVYQRSRFRTITKMFGISFMYFMAFAISINIIFLVTAALV